MLLPLHIDYYAFSALLNFLTSFILGIFLLSKNKANPINYTFCIFALSVAFWSLGYFIWQIFTDSSEEALFWTRILMIGAIYTPITYLNFIFALFGTLKAKKKFLFLSYCLFTGFLPFVFSPLFISHVEQELSFEFWPKPGILFHFFLIIWFSYLIYAVCILLKSYKKIENIIDHNQIKYVLIAMIIAFAGGSTNYFLWYGIPIPPVGNIFVSLYVIIIGYAILKHHLFDIRVIAIEIFTLVVLTFLLVDVLLSEVSNMLYVRLGILLLTAILGVFVIRSTNREIHYRAQEVAYKELKQLDASKAQFITIAAHQLRTPLSAIKGYSSMALDGDFGKVTPQFSNAFSRIKTSAERLILLADNLLNVARMEQGNLELMKKNTDMVYLIQRIIDQFTVFATKKSLTLSFQKPSDTIPHLDIDPEKIAKVLETLLDNAIRYTDKGSVRVAIEKEDGKILISVKDTGRGLADAERETIFQSFSRGEGAQEIWTEGVGLNLYIARKFVEAHGGKIWAESEGKGKGASFFVGMPFYKEKDR